MSLLRKRYIRSRNVCKVTFELSETELLAGVKAESVHLVGEFNDWDHNAAPLTRRKGGVFSVTLELAPGSQYQFRYLVNGVHWCNNCYEDAYLSTGFGESNCVVITPP